VVGVVFVRKTREAPNRVSNPVQPCVRLRRSACRGARCGVALDSTPFDACLAQVRASSPLGLDPQEWDLSWPGFLQAPMSDRSADSSTLLQICRQVRYSSFLCISFPPVSPFVISFISVPPLSTFYPVLFFHPAALPPPPFSRVQLQCDGTR
jgi:hypothetical protein